MSVVTVQLGQCGNQIGSQFFATVVDDIRFGPSGRNSQIDESYNETCIDKFFSVDSSGKWMARAVMVDMEQKVITQTLADSQRSGRWLYAPGSHVCERRGSGNNWACGYFRHGQRAAKPTMEAVRRIVERCDRVGGFIAHMSLAGGTGSGLGAYMTRCLRDEYPHSFIVNQVIWPYNTGEVIVQNYNAVLSLAHLYQSADAIIALENDALHAICTRLLAIPKVSFYNINRVIARQLASVLTPVCAEKGRGLVRNQIGDMLEQLVPHPAYKLTTVRSVPHVSDRSADYTTYQWPGLLRHLRQMLIANSQMEEGIDWQVKPGSSNSARSVSNLLVLRGKDSELADVSGFREPTLYSSRPFSVVNSDVPCALWSHDRPFLGREKSVTLVSNGQCSVIGGLDRTIDRAWRMFASRAFVHQYVAHGLQEEDFIDCFATLEQILADYKRL